MIASDNDFDLEIDIAKSNISFKDKETYRQLKMKYKDNEAFWDD